MVKILILLRKFIYRIAILVLAISATFLQVSISSKILGVWSLLIAVGLHKNNHFLLKVLLHDFDLTYHEQSKHKRPIQVVIAVAFAILCFFLPFFYTL